LGELVMNLRWSWDRSTHDLFEKVDPKVWQACAGDPVRLLGQVSSQRLSELAADSAFLDRLHAAADDLRDYLSGPRWYQSVIDQTQDGAAQISWPAAIAYFSPEFGITEVLPQYSGGLGILAGDHLKAASDLGVPLLGVGLLYRSGYFSQSLSADGWQLEHYPALDPHGLPLALARAQDGTALRVTVELPEGARLSAQVWIAQVGRIPLLLLDSDVEENGAAERGVTDRLYGGGEDHRLRQELLLGIGGVRAIRAYCSITGHPEPEVFHTNEGHAGFLGIERIRELTEHGPKLGFAEALEAVRAGTVFTTHTPVPAGIDRFPRSLIKAQFADLEPAIPVERLLALGAEDDADKFNMAHMGLRLSGRANGVSQLHGQVSREMFSSLWPGFDDDEVPISSITNGVHDPTWVAREIQQLGEPSSWPETFDGQQLWKLRRNLRGQLITEIRRRLRASAAARGTHPAELAWVDSAFDPETLTIGFARRVPSYKRLTLMLRDPERLRALLLDPQRPLQMVIAGKSHPADEGGKKLIQDMVRFTDDAEVRHRIAFLPDYDIGMARYLYWGCDVWLNNPLRPLEACGTSGMKSALNGGLNLSIRDGWWDEMYDGQNGWAIPTADGVDDPTRRDDLEAEAIYDLLGKQVLPSFYETDATGVPTRWVEMVRHTLTTLSPKVLASRMVRDYVTELYGPAASASAAFTPDGFAGAAAFAAWRSKVSTAWPGVQVAHVDASGVGDIPELGAPLTMRAQIELPGLSPADVDVQAVYGRVDDHEQLHDVTTSSMRLEGSDGDQHWYVGEVPLTRSGPFGYTVRVLPAHPRLTGPAELGLVVTAAS
ncbi:MAG: alpha-glucan family phosphorylase, partial [Actinomycetota bacterium]|nr:alpha-glucan family phosphorylase [Actinomycetota bacterium]